MHVVVVGVVVDHGARQHAQHRVEARGGTAEGGRDQVAAPARGAAGARENRLRRGVHAPLEIAVERGVVEARERPVQVGQEGAEGLQHGGRPGAQFGERDAGQPGGGRGQVRRACEGDGDNAGARGGRRGVAGCGCEA